MAASPKNWRDKIWLVWFAVQIFVITLVDAVPMYPAWLYKETGSPLHFLQKISDYYIETYNDPLVQSATEPNWIQLFFLVELAFSLPTAIYAAFYLSGTRGTTGPLELLWLVYAFETAFSTLICINEIFYFDPAVYSQDAKNVFMYHLYGPWFVIPSLLFVDMYWRLYSRLSTTDLAKKNQ